MSGSEDTSPVKGHLKRLGFQWNARKREWYYPTQAADLETDTFESLERFLREERIDE